jgi:hypothetical protein
MRVRSSYRRGDKTAASCRPPGGQLGCRMPIRTKVSTTPLLMKDLRAAVPLKHLVISAIEADCKARSLDAEARWEERRRPRCRSSAHSRLGRRDSPQAARAEVRRPRRATTYAINQRASSALLRRIDGVPDRQRACWSAGSTLAVAGAAPFSSPARQAHMRAAGGRVHLGGQLPRSRYRSERYLVDASTAERDWPPRRLSS